MVSRKHKEKNTNIRMLTIVCGLHCFLLKGVTGNVWWLSLSAKSTFNPMNLGGYVYIIVFFILNNDDKNVTANTLVV